MDLTRRSLEFLHRGPQQRQLVGEVETDASVGGSDRTRADPHHFSTGAQRVQVDGLIAAHTCAQHVGLETRGDDCTSLHHRDRLDECVLAALSRRNALPRGKESCVRTLLDRFDLLAQQRK